MSKQEIFDKVLSHSRQMVAPSRNRFEGVTVTGLSPKIQERCGLFSGELVEFAVALQLIHDYHFSDREEQLKALALVHNLTWTPAKEEVV